MKIRNGFVSNSSSSSFVVIGTSSRYVMKNSHVDEEMVVDGSFGECEFGWGPEKLEYWGDRIIFAFLQTCIVSNEKWLKMLEEVIKDHTGTTKIIWNITDNWKDKEKSQGYIDHQSSAAEGENIEIFDSKEKLFDFLFNADSYIQLDNDNRDIGDLYED